MTTVSFPLVSPISHTRKGATKANSHVSIQLTPSSRPVWIAATLALALRGVLDDVERCATEAVAMTERENGTSAIAETAPVANVAAFDPNALAAMVAALSRMNSAPVAEVAAPVENSVPAEVAKPADDLRDEVERQRSRARARDAAGAR